MVESIIQYLDTQLSGYDYYSKQWGLVEVITQGDKTFPAQYCEGGKYTDISTFNRKNGVCYFRKNGRISAVPKESNLISCKRMVEFTVPLRFVSIIPRKKLETDTSYSDDELALELVRILSAKENGLKTTLGAKSVVIETQDWDTNSANVFSEEYSVSGNNQLDSKYSYVSINLQVLVSINRECIETMCTDLTPCQILLNSLSTNQLNTCILPTYDFTDSNVQNNVTAQQQTDLIAWLCGGSGAVDVKDTDGNTLGTTNPPNDFTVNDANVSNSNNSYVETVLAEGTLNLPDIDFTDSDGVTTSVPSMENIVATPCVTNRLSAKMIYEELGTLYRPASFLFGDTDFTFGGTIETPDNPTAQSGFGVWLNTGNNRSWMVFFTATELRVALSSDGTSGNTTTFATPFAVDTTYFVVCSYDSVANEMNVSINGGAFTTLAHSGGAKGTSTEPFYVGRYNGSGGIYSKAMVDNVFMYNSALNIAECQALENQNYSDLTAGQKTNLISWYGFDELPPNAVTDEHGANDLTTSTDRFSSKPL